MKKRFIRVNLTFMVGTLTVNVKGKIIEAPPILRCWIGSRYDKFYSYYERKGKLVKTEVLKDHKDIKQTRLSL